MAGALHVFWTNVQTDCDKVELERKTNSEPYKVAYTLPADANNKHDSAATSNTMYTYRARCQKSQTYSPYSNEMSGNPM